MNVYLLCSAILVIVYFLLAFNVSLKRFATKIAIGSDDPRTGILHKSIRAHGNAAEYIPMFVLLFLYFNSVGATGWIIWLTVAVTASRLLHALGMVMSPDLGKPQIFRFIGSVGTYVGGLAFGVALLLQGFA